MLARSVSVYRGSCFMDDAPRAFRATLRGYEQQFDYQYSIELQVVREYP